MGLVSDGPLEHAPLTAIVGNPRLASRTRTVAEATAARLAALLGIDSPPLRTIELAEVAGELFDPTSQRVRDLVSDVSSSTAVIVASPTFKATYSGLLKAFLDWFTTTSLAGVPTVPVMVGAAPHHGLAVEVHLRPLLVELGASLPTRGLYVLESQVPELDTVLDGWAETARGALDPFRH